MCRFISFVQPRLGRGDGVPKAPPKAAGQPFSMDLSGLSPLGDQKSGKPTRKTPHRTSAGRAPPHGCGPGRFSPHMSHRGGDVPAGAGWRLFEIGCGRASTGEGHALERIAGECRRCSTNKLFEPRRGRMGTGPGSVHRPFDHKPPDVRMRDDARGRPMGVEDPPAGKRRPRPMALQGTGADFDKTSGVNMSIGPHTNLIRSISRLHKNSIPPFWVG